MFEFLIQDVLNYVFLIPLHVNRGWQLAGLKQKGGFYIWLQQGCIEYLVNFEGSGQLQFVDDRVNLVNYWVQTEKLMFRFAGGSVCVYVLGG